MKNKITILGGGSPFVLAMVKAMIDHREALNDSEICLMDIDPARLPTIVKFCRVISGRAGADFDFSHTTDPRQALEDSSFVFPTYRVGGLEHMKYDIQIPNRHGISGDETTGPGGTFMAQMTIPVTLKYCRLIEELCPDARVISVVNPANAVADAVFRETDLNYISICDCFAGFSMELLPRILNMPPIPRKYCVSDDLHPRAMGVNHLTWLIELTVNGSDGYPLLRNKLKKYKDKTMHDQEPIDFSLRLFETYDYLNVCPTHVLPYWEQEEFLKERKERIFEEEVLGWSDKRWKFVQDVIEGAEYDSHPEEYCFSSHHSNQAVGIMISILLDEGREWGGINFINNGAISNLPPDAVVEGPAVVDGKGIHPVDMGKLPTALVGITNQVINWQELTVDAALSGNKNRLFQALLACPYVNDMEKARAIMEELLEAHRKYLLHYSNG